MPILPKRESTNIGKDELKELRAGLSGGKILYEPMSISSAKSGSAKPLMIHLGEKKLAIFGPSPELVFDPKKPDDLYSFLALGQVKRVILLDTKRLSMRPTRELTEVDASNLIDHYAHCHVEVIYQHGHTRFDLADMDGLPEELQKTGLDGCKKDLLKLLGEGYSLGKALAVLEIQAVRIEKFYDEYGPHVLKKEKSESQESYRERVADLVYFPTSVEILGFLLSLYDSFNKGKYAYVHRVAGSGRTGLYLVCLIMFIRNCDFEDAADDIKMHYPLAKDEINKYKPCAERFHDKYIV
ncbi:MAG: hypothetical protein K0U29_08715 [Gammaproteobacteria bacterium]|nr:hypothetical protein [Gammaproteobacteria bacterium]MCH9744994.1 hypothetical protein [Gammaproteobacteria bacterium]